jgi:hypothetical protein
MSAIDVSRQRETLPDAIPVLDPDGERVRHKLWRRVAKLRAKVMLEPTFEARCELADALEALRRGGAHG